MVCYEPGADACILSPAYVMNQNDETPPSDEEELFATVDPLESYDPDLTTDHPPPGTPSDRLEQTVASDRPIDHDVADPTRLSYQQLDEIAKTQIDKICAEFDAAWQQDGASPSIHSFLPDESEFEGEARQALAEKLVSLDIRHRARLDRSLPKTEYLNQLPGFIDGVESAFVQMEQNVAHGDAHGRTQIRSGKPRSGGSISQRADESHARYQPTEIHARGGLGAVYRARDHELKRIVALKEILPEHGDKVHYQEKFIFEAEVTGSLEHPGIVPVYGLGRYRDNQPYYAMRFIRGHSFSEVIKGFHRAHPTLTPDVYLGREFRSLLRRLIDACNAIQFAHEHGVLHRDIKPANIMLGRHGETLVVDWGLAKVITSSVAATKERGLTVFEGLSGSGSSKTRLGAIVGTPMYMSPEQALGDNDSLDGRTDIYSLGAVLFNLITGATPIDGRTSIDIIKNVRSGNVRRVDRLKPSAPRPLASICAKAMSRDREDRYQNATELGDDLDRWMNDELALAHVDHESTLERAGRLIRRYRSWTISGAAAMLLVTAIAIASALVVNRARRSERVARIEAQQYKENALQRYRESRDAIDTWLVQSSDALEYFPGTRAVRKRLLDRAVDDYKRLSQSESADPELELERGKALVRVGDLMQEQQEFDQAQQYYQDALTVFQNASAQDVHGTEMQTEAAGTRIRIAVGFAESGKIPDAELEFRQAIDTLSRLADQPSNGRARRLLAGAYVHAGQLYVDSKPERALEELSDALDAYASVGDSSDEIVELGIASARNLLGQIHRDQGDHQKAMQYFDQSVESLEQLVRERPDQPEFLDALASTYVSMAASYRTRGLESPMFDALNQAARHFRNLSDSLPGVPRYESNLAITLTDLALAEHEAGLDDQAEKTSGQADEMLTELVRTYGQSPKILESYAVCQDARGQILLDLKGDPADSLRIAEDALIQLTQSAESDEQVMHLFERLAIVQSHLAQAYGQLGDSDLAAAKFSEAIERLNSLLQIRGRLPRLINALAHVHSHYATLLHGQQDPSATAHFVSARDLWVEIVGDSAGSHSDSLAWMLVSCPIENMRDPEAACRYADAAIQAAPENFQFLCTLALSQSLAGKDDEANETIAKIAALGHEFTDRYQYVLALHNHTGGKRAEAREAFEAAEAWRQEHHPFAADMKMFSDFVAGKLGG